MERRHFVTALTAAGAALAARRASASESLPAWAWVHGGGERSSVEWRRAFARVRAAGITGVLVSGGDTAMLADAAHEAGVAFHRWLWICNRNGDAWAQEQHPEWFTVSRNGESSLTHPPYVGYYKWVCPTRPPVRAYLAEQIAAVAADPHVDGVHLDYIRHCDVILPRALWDTYGLVQDHEMPEFDFCYCDVCRATFREQTGRDPLALPDPTVDLAWREFRWASVTGLVRQLATVVRAHDKPISAAVFPTPTIARTLVRQAWDQWPLDMVFPMLYHSFYEEAVAWIGPSVREGLTALAGGPTRLHAGLYLPDLPPAALAEAIGVARHAGAAGVSVFEMGGLTDAHLEALRGALAP